jgi:hypothetical protein
MSITSDEQEHVVFERAKKEAFFGAPFLGSKMGTLLDHINAQHLNEVLCNNTQLMCMHSNTLNNKNGLMLWGSFLGFRGGPAKSRHSTGMGKTLFFGYF